MVLGPDFYYYIRILVDFQNYLKNYTSLKFWFKNILNLGSWGQIFNRLVPVL